jgi:hypothetical protein
MLPRVSICIGIHTTQPHPGASSGRHVGTSVSYGGGDPVQGMAAPRHAGVLSIPTLHPRHHPQTSFPLLDPISDATQLLFIVFSAHPATLSPPNRGVVLFLFSFIFCLMINRMRPRYIGI